MSTFTLTYEDWSVMDQEDRALVEALPKYKAIVLEFKQKDSAEDIAFATQKFFALPDGSEVSLEVLEMLMYSQLGGKSDDTTQYGVLKTAAYGLKDRIKAGQKAAGILYHFGIKELKAKNALTK